MPAKYPVMRSLKELHDYLIEQPDKKDIYVFFDFDMTIIDDEKDVLLEPEVTRKLIKYLVDNEIYFAIVTARYWDSACNDKKRNLKDMERNIRETIHPRLEELGLDVSAYKHPHLSDKFEKYHNERGQCVGIHYRGIIFGHRKGEIIKSYMKSTPHKRSKTIFIDDYDPYLANVRKHHPQTLAIKRDFSMFV